MFQIRVRAVWRVAVVAAFLAVATVEVESSNGSTPTSSSLSGYIIAVG